MRRLFLQLFYRPCWARLRHDRNGELLAAFMDNERPMAKVRIPRPGKGGNTLIKNVPYEDVLFITQYPSRFDRLVGRKKIKNFTIQIKK